MKNSKESLEGAYNNALDLILNKKLKEGEKLLEKIYGSGNINIDILNLLGIIKYMYLVKVKLKNLQISIN